MRSAFILKIVICTLILSTPAIDVCASKGFESIMPEGDLFKKIETPFTYYEVYKKDSLIGYCFNTRDVVPEIEGYSGTIEILVAVDREYKIQNLKILSHSETPEYAGGIPGLEFLGQFKGKGPDDKFQIGDDVDAVTQATVSSVAVTNILKSSITKMITVIEGTQEQEKKSDTLIKLEKSGLEPKEAKYYRVIDE